MQSPKFILKNKYLEKNVDRDYEYHLKKLGQIKNKVTVKTAIDKDQDQMDQVMRRHKNQIKASKFRDDELDRERNLETGSLFDRVLGANQSLKQNTHLHTKSQLSQTQLLHTKSLLLVVQKNEESRIMEENYKLAKRMQNLPPVISSLGLQTSYTKHKDDVQLARKFHKLQPLTAIPLTTSKFSVYVDVLNDLTNNQFEECKSHITFPVIEERVSKNTMFCVLYIQNMKVFNDYDLANPKIPPKFCWEVKYKNKSLCMTIPKAFNKICKDLVDFVFKKNSTDKIDLILWKIKNYDETYIGQIEIGPDDFDEGEVVQEFHKKMIKQKFIEKEIYKKVNSVKAFLGTVQFKLIQFCSKNIPQNKHSGIPGSPRSGEERKIIEKIEESKFTAQDEYDWQAHQDEEHQIIQIMEATKEGLIVIINTDEQVQVEIFERFHKWNDRVSLVETFDENNKDLRKKSTVQVRKMKKDDVKSIQVHTKTPDSEAFLEIYKKLKEAGYKGKVSRKMIEDSQKDSNCTLNQLLLHKRDDMNLSLMSVMLLEDQFQTILEVLNKMDILREHDSVLEDLSQDIFGTIARHLRKNDALKTTKVFIKALESYPAMGLIIFRYATSDINIHIKEGKSNIFLSNFDMSNYEHIMILGRFIKLCDKHLSMEKIPKDHQEKYAKMIKIGQDWLSSIKQAYALQKRNIYFKVPILPKKGQLTLKTKYLQLVNLESNIFNEIARRKRWTLFTRTYPNACKDTTNGGVDWYFQKDTTQHSPFMNFLQYASFEEIKNFMSSVDTELCNGALHITSKQLQECVTSSGKNVFHLLILNKDHQQDGLLMILQILMDRLGSDATSKLLTSAWGSGYVAHKAYTKKLPNAKMEAAIQGKYDKFSPDFTPIVLYLERLACRSKKNKKQVKGIHSINHIMKVLSEPFVRKDSAILRSLYNLHFNLGIQVEHTMTPEIQNFYQDHQQVVRCLLNLEDTLFDQVIENFNWINWIGPLHDDIGTTLLQCLIKASKFNRCTIILDQIMESGMYLQSKLDTSIVVDEEQQKQYDEFLLVERGRILVACLGSLREVSDQDKQQQEDKLLLQNSMSQRIRSFTQQNPNILFKSIKGRDSTLLNQIYLAKQEAIISKLPLPNYSQASIEVVHETLNFAFMRHQHLLLESEIIKALVSSIDDKITIIRYFAIVPDTLLKIFPMDCLNSKITFEMKVFVNQPTLIQTITENITRMRQELMDKSKAKIEVTINDSHELIQQEQPGQEQPGQEQTGQEQTGQEQPGQEQPGQEQPGDLQEEPSEYYDVTLLHPYQWFLDVPFPVKLLKSQVLNQKSEQFFIFLGFVYRLIERSNYSNLSKWDDVFRDYIYECLSTTPSSKQLYAGFPVSTYFGLMRSHTSLINVVWLRKLFLLFLRQENYCGLHHVLHLLTTQNMHLYDANVNQFYYNRKDLKNYFDSASKSHNSVKKNWALTLNNKQFANMLTDLKEQLTDTDINGLCNILAVNGLYEKLKMVSDKVRNEYEFLCILERTSYLAYHQILDMYYYVYTPLIVQAQMVHDQIKLNEEQQDSKNINDSIESMEVTIKSDVSEQLKQTNTYSEVWHRMSVWGYVETFYPQDIHQVVRVIKLSDKQSLSPALPTSEKHKAPPISKWYNLHSGQLSTLVNSIYKQAWPLSNRLKSYQYFAGTVEKLLHRQEYQQSIKRSMLNSNPSTLFVQKREHTNKDYTQVITILVDQVIQRKMLKKTMTPKLGELAIKIISQCWLSLGNFEKIAELLSQIEDPYTKRAIVKLVKNATKVFSDKTRRPKQVSKVPPQNYPSMTMDPNITLEQFILQHKQMTNQTNVQRHKKNPFKTKTLTNIFPHLVVFMKKHLNSTALPAILPNEEYFYQNIKSVFSERLQDLTLNQRFVIEFILTIESNFTPQEISQIPIDYVIQEENNGLIFERLPSLLLNLKTNDKKVVSFLQKHLSKKNTEHTPILKDPVSIYQGNQEFIISMAKQGVNCFMEPPNIQKQIMFKGKEPRTVTFKHINLFAQQDDSDDGKSGSGDWDQVSNPKLNLLEYLLFKGADYLLNGYFLPHLKPKGGLSEPEKKRLLMCSLQSGNQTCLQMVLDEILNLKGAEFKNIVLKYSLMQAVAKNENPATLLWFVKKKLRIPEFNNKEDTYQMMGVTKESIREGYVPLLVSVAHKHQCAFYKEFFHEFIYKHVLKSHDAEFKEVMQTIFYFKRKDWNISQPEQWNLLEYCLNYQFYDVIQTFVSLGMVYPEDQIEQHRAVLDKIPLSRSFFALQSSQNIDNQLRQDYFQQMNLLQAALRLYKICKTQTTLNQSLTALNSFEAGMFLLPYFKSVKHDFKPMTDVVPSLIQMLALGEFQFSTLGEFSESDLTKDIVAKLFLLHMNGVDKQLQYTLTVDKFVEKNILVKQNKIYTQIWKNKEVLELISVILNDNITDGFKHKFTTKPTRQEIFELCYRSLPQSGTNNLLFEYFSANDPSLFTKPLQFTDTKNSNFMLPQSIYSDLLNSDQRFLMIVVRGIADKGSQDLFEELLQYLVERANEITSETNLQEFMGFKRNILCAITALLMVNPQKYSKSILSMLKQIHWISPMKEDLPHAAQILCALFNFEGSFNNLSNSLKTIMDGLNKNTTYSLISEVKPLGDLGVNINDEKIYLEGVKLMVEEALKQTHQKVFFPSDTFSRIISSSVKQSLPVHGDKIFKGFAIMKVFVDIAREIENLSYTLQQDPNQKIGELEYRIEVLQADSANKQQVVLLQQGMNTDDKYKFLFKLPIGLLKTDPSQPLSIYPHPQLSHVQVDQAKTTLSQVYLDKFIKIQWSDDLTQLEKLDIFVKVQWDGVNTENMIYFGKDLYNLFGLRDLDSDIQRQLKSLGDSKFVPKPPTKIKVEVHQPIVLSKPRISKSVTKTSIKGSKSPGKQSTQGKSPTAQVNDPKTLNRHQTQANNPKSQKPNQLKDSKSLTKLPSQAQSPTKQSTKAKSPTIKPTQVKDSKSPIKPTKVKNSKVVTQIPPQVTTVPAKLPVKHSKPKQAPSPPSEQDRYKTQYKPEDNKILISEKEQELPKSNYVQRFRKTNLKIKLENEFTFVELYGDFSYHMKPSYSIQIVSQQEFSKRLKPTAMVHQAINDLYSYTSMTAECIRVVNGAENQILNRKAEVFKTNIVWPVYFDSSDELVHQAEFHPYKMISGLQYRFDDWLNFIPTEYTKNRHIKISILSVLETTVLRLAQILEKNLKQFKSIDMSMIVDLALQWNLPKLIIMTVLELLDGSGWDSKNQAFKSVYIEMTEVESKKCYDSKIIGNQLEGLDQIFRLAPTSFYVHNGTLIVRLNVCLIKNDPSPLDNLINKSFKIKNYVGSHYILLENQELKNYMNSIVNKESMQTQIIAPKRNQ